MLSLLVPDSTSQAREEMQVPLEVRPACMREESYG